MIKNKKRLISIALVSLSIFSFVVSAYAYTWLHPTHHYVEIGTHVSGGTYDLYTSRSFKILYYVNFLNLFITIIILGIS